MFHLAGVTKMIQVRNVPEPLHRELVERARARGMTLTAYIQELLEREVARPPREDVFERVAGREEVDLGAAAADLLRAERDRDDVHVLGPASGTR